ncbi:hypothetical protein LUZ60_006077 [Juncus effusus]|nr:hypothetical protein LUZ60_006077 [Juncus effusus]
MPGIWSRHRDEITIDRLQKFWNELPIQARNTLLRIDKQTLFEQARKNLYCSRCNGLLLESFTQIVMYGKSLQHHHEGNSVNLYMDQEDDDVAQDPAVHPWGGLAATKDGLLTLLDCFINSRSLTPLQNVFDSARAREREREMLYPDACGGEGRGWMSSCQAGGPGPGSGYGRGTRETCALHTARLSCDTLMDFWSALGDETRASLMQMKEDDFIERLMYRFDSKRFCRDCRRNVIREFKELKELKRMRREPRCNILFCGADTAFQYEVSDTSVEADWADFFASSSSGKYHHFDFGVGTSEGKSDVLEFSNVGLTTSVHKSDLNLSNHASLYIGLRAWRNDGKCNEYCVKAHAMKGELCVHRRLVVGDGIVGITKGEGMRRFFEHAEEAEEEDEEDAMEREGSDMDGDGSHPQKHAKSPELAREFLLDSATVIFKEQVEKAFREGTARQNAHSVFVSLALKLLEDRVHVACKEIITLEKQTLLLEEEEKEKREEEERKERRRNKEREKKLRRKERLLLKGKENREKEEAEPESESQLPDPEPEFNSRISPETESPLKFAEITSCATETLEGESSGTHQCQDEESFILEQSKSTRRKLKYTCNSDNLGANKCTNQVKKTNRSSDLSYRSRYEYSSCGCGDQNTAYHQNTYKPRQPYYRSLKYGSNNTNGFASETVQKSNTVGTVKKDVSPKQVWEPMSDSRKKIASSPTPAVTTSESNNSSTDFKANGNSDEVSDTCQKHKEQQTTNENHSDSCINSSKSENSNQNTGKADSKNSNNNNCNGSNGSLTNNVCNGSNGSLINNDLDNCSSCLSEGDSSTTSISSGPHNESSSSTSDSEDASQQSEKSETTFQKDPSKESDSQSSPQRVNSNPRPLSAPQSQNGFVPTNGAMPPVHAGTVQVQTQPMQQHMPAPYFPTVGLGFHNQPVPVQVQVQVQVPVTSWAGPTNGYTFGHYNPYPNHHHLGFGVPAVRYTGPAVHYSNPPSISLNHQQHNPNLPVYNKQNITGSRFGLFNSDPVNRRVLLPENPNPVRRNHLNPVRTSDNNEGNLMKKEERNGDLHSCAKEEASHFSLFHFGGPMADRVQGKNEEERNGGVHCGAGKEGDVKEYNLFSSQGSFSFF